MTPALPLSDHGLNGISLRLIGLLVVLPALLAAGLAERSSRESALPEADAYRSPFSETILESNRWRSSAVEKQDWRLPPPPPAGWRTSPTSESEISSSQRNIELFPAYKPGVSSNYDMIEREEKPLIKMFEFGSK